MTKGHAIYMQQLRKQAKAVEQPATAPTSTIISLNQSIEKLREENEKLLKEKQHLQQRLQELMKNYK